MSLFDAPKFDAPKEDPAVAAARRQQQQQADLSLTGAIQTDLRRKMASRIQRFGLGPSSPGFGIRPAGEQIAVAPPPADPTWDAFTAQVAAVPFANLRAKMLTEGAARYSGMAPRTSSLKKI